jgi:hypothetical protein
MQDTLAPKKPHVHRSWHLHASAVTASAVGGLLFADPGSRVRGRGVGGAVHSLVKWSAGLQLAARSVTMWAAGGSPSMSETVITFTV